MLWNLVVKIKMLVTSSDYLGESVIHMCVEKVHEFLHERQATEDEINRGVVESKLAEQQVL